MRDEKKIKESEIEKSIKRLKIGKPTRIEMENTSGSTGVSIKKMIKTFTEINLERKNHLKSRELA